MPPNLHFNTLTATLILFICEHLLLHLRILKEYLMGLDILLRLHSQLLFFFLLSSPSKVLPFHYFNRYFCIFLHVFEVFNIFAQLYLVLGLHGSLVNHVTGRLAVFGREWGKRRITWARHRVTEDERWLEQMTVIVVVRWVVKQELIDLLALTECMDSLSTSNILFVELTITLVLHLHSSVWLCVWIPIWQVLRPWQHVRNSAQSIH